MAILKKLYLLLLPVMGLPLAGCYEDFDPRIDTQPVLCLNSLITAGEPIEVKISRTWVYTDKTGTTDHSVPDVTLSIYANGNPVDEDYIPKEGDSIRIHAYSPTYGEAEAEVSVPVATCITDVDFTSKLRELRIQDIPGWGLNAEIIFDIRISMDIQDDGATDDYHRLTYAVFNNNKGGIWGDDDDGTGSYSWSLRHAVLSGGNFDALDPVFYQQVDPFDDVMYGSYYCMFFSDRTYNGEVRSLNFGFSNCRFDLSGWDDDTEYLECGWKMTLHSISESYYNWLAYCEQSDGVVIGDFSSFGMADPIWGYSNVSTGAGVVAAQSLTTATVDIKDFLQKTLEKAEKQ